MKISIKKVIDFPIEKQMEIREWRNSDFVSKHFLISYIDEETHRNWLESQKKEKPSSIAFFIYDEEAKTEEEKFLGCNYITHIDYDNLTCEAGIFLNPNVQAEGVGQISSVLLNEFIFNELGIYKINTRVLGENKRVILAHKRGGLILEGVLKGQVLKNNQRYDIYLFALFRDMWLESKDVAFEYIRDFI